VKKDRYSCRWRQSRDDGPPKSCRISM